MNDEVMLRYGTIRSYEVRTVAIGQIFFLKIRVRGMKLYVVLYGNVCVCRLSRVR